MYVYMLFDAQHQCTKPDVPTNKVTIWRNTTVMSEYVRIDFRIVFYILLPERGRRNHTPGVMEPKIWIDSQLALVAYHVSLKRVWMFLKYNLCPESGVHIGLCLEAAWSMTKRAHSGQKMWTLLSLEVSARLAVWIFRAETMTICDGRRVALVIRLQAVEELGCRGWSVGLAPVMVGKTEIATKNVQIK